MNRKPKLTKRERKALAPARPAQPQGGHDQHIHCVACGLHLDASQFDPPSPSATIVTCAHGSSFPSCVECEAEAQRLLDEHDRTGQPVRAAGARH
jgi:hypothetical protein